MRVWMIVLILFAVAGSLSASADAPMVPYGGAPTPGGPMVPGTWLPMVPGPVSGGPVNPCSNKLDFSQACNSQYVAAVFQ